MLLVVVGVVFAVPVLWAVSVGALRDVRRARRLDPRTGCQAWVAVAGLRDRRYRCGHPVYAGGPWCRRHEAHGAPGEVEHDPDLRYLEEPQAVGRALVQARIGVPLAVLAVLGCLSLAVWAIQRAW